VDSHNKLSGLDLGCLGRGFVWSRPVLINDYTGAPNAYGQGYKDHLALLKQNWTRHQPYRNSGGPTATQLAFHPHLYRDADVHAVVTGPLKMQVHLNGVDTTQENRLLHQGE